MTAPATGDRADAGGKGKASADLYSDAMDAAVNIYCTAGRMSAYKADDGETAKRRQIAAAIDAYIEEKFPALDMRHPAGSPKERAVAHRSSRAPLPLSPSSGGEEL